MVFTQATLLLIIPRRPLRYPPGFPCEQPSWQQSKWYLTFVPSTHSPQCVASCKPTEHGRHPHQRKPIRPCDSCVHVCMCGCGCECGCGCRCASTYVSPLASLQSTAGTLTNVGQSGHAIAVCVCVCVGVGVDVGVGVGVGVGVWVWVGVGGCGCGCGCVGMHVCTQM